VAQLVVQVIDRDTREPLPWVYVEVDGRALQTGMDGTATFVLPVGTYTLRVRTMLYSPYTATITIPREGTFRYTVPLIKAHL